jgi:hypothetical protein
MCGKWRHDTPRIESFEAPTLGRDYDYDRERDRDHDYDRERDHGTEGAGHSR